MNVPNRSAMAWISAALLLTLIACAGCSDQSPTTPWITAGPGGGGLAVNATDPTEAPQDTTLDVRVLGSGFDRGSNAEWAIAGVPSSKVRTNSTRFVSSKELVANITIALEADTVLYDVIVTTTTGKKGIGTELFKVRAKGPPPENPQAIFEYPADDAAFKVRSDHRAEYLSADGLTYIYEAGVCGVGAQVFAFGSGDATMDPDAVTIKGSQKQVCGAARAITIILDQPADAGPPRANPVATGGYFNVFNELWQMPIGVEQEVQGGFNGAGCNVLRFKPDPGHNGIAYPGSDKLLAVRLDASRWRVRTKPYPDNKGWCDAEGRFYHLPFELTVRVK